MKQSLATLRNVRIFVASPVDVTQERERLRRVAQKINDSVGHQLGFHLEVVGWETHVVPDIGGRPQAIINEQIEPYDVFVGIMWKRFGTPTGEAGSGTEEEFDRAFESRKAFGVPRIMFYFNQKRFMPKDQDEVEQVSKVLAFRNRLRQEGLAWEYQGVENYADIVDRHLCTLVVQLHKETEAKIARVGKERTTLAPWLDHPYVAESNFTGRVEERALLADWLEKDPTPMMALVGIGGMGKSYLAWHWVNAEVLGRQDTEVCGVFWWSFYDRESGFEEFLDACIEWASQSKVNSRSMTSTWEKVEKFFEIFGDKGFLVVLDGVERLLREYTGLGSPYRVQIPTEGAGPDSRSCVDSNVGKFLQWLSAGYPRTKTLLTTRVLPHELDVIAGCRNVELRGLAKSDAVDFMLAQGIKGQRIEVERACERCGYYPLYLRLLCGVLARNAQHPGEIGGWEEHDAIAELKQEQHHILDVAYEALEPAEQHFLSKVAALRFQAGYEAIAALSTFGSRLALDQSLAELAVRGLLLVDQKSGNYDMHPVVRSYCYARLEDKEVTHSQLRAYFASTPVPERLESVSDIAPLIEIYHHTAKSGAYDDAFELFSSRLEDVLFRRFSSYGLVIEILAELFPLGVDGLPELKRKTAQVRVLNTLANCSCNCGQPQRAIGMYEKVLPMKVWGDGIAGAIVLRRLLGNLACAYTDMGRLEVAEEYLRASWKVAKDSGSALDEAIAREDLGVLLSYRGEFKKSLDHFRVALGVFTHLGQTQLQCELWADRAVRAILMGEGDSALHAAERSRQLADSGVSQADVIRSEWLLGCAYYSVGRYDETQVPLDRALAGCRRTNMVYAEPDILLGLARLRRVQEDRQDALALAREAAGIADRCGYQLRQADIYGFLAEFHMDDGNWVEAKRCAEIAKERALCGYKIGLAKANGLLSHIDREERGRRQR